MIAGRLGDVLGVFCAVADNNFAGGPDCTLTVNINELRKCWPPFHFFKISLKRECEERKHNPPQMVQTEAVSSPYVMNQLNIPTKNNIHPV